MDSYTPANPIKVCFTSMVSVWMKISWHFCCTKGVMICEWSQKSPAVVHFSICRGTALGTGPCHKRVTYRWNQSMQCQCLRIWSSLRSSVPWLKERHPGTVQSPHTFFSVSPYFPVYMYIIIYIYTHNVPDVHHYITCQISYIIHMGARCRFLLVAIPHGIVPPHNGTVILPTGAFFCYTPRRTDIPRNHIQVSQSGNGFAEYHQLPSKPPPGFELVTFAHHNNWVNEGAWP